MMINLFSFILVATMWVQVPQWNADWSKCSIDVPDIDCHWYITNPDNTFGSGFSWKNAPWFSVEGLLDVSKLKNTMTNLQNH
tara:strand:- start:428 stop:673 length:246 start_codon:yes stop_codon:yes gene_type:complete